MNLTKYIGAAHAELIRFQDWWAGKHNKNPAYFPMEMPAGEWNKQLRLWQSSSEN